MGGRLYFRTEAQQESYAIQRVNESKSRALARVAMLTEQQVSLLEASIDAVRPLKGKFRYYVFEDANVRYYPELDDDGNPVADDLPPDSYIIEAVDASDTRHAPLVDLVPRFCHTKITYTVSADELHEARDDEIIATPNLEHPKPETGVPAVNGARPRGIAHD